MALELNDANIDDTINNNKITIIDFWAAWCGPCKLLGPVIEELAKDNAGIAIGKLDVDANNETAKKFGIRGIPTVLFYKDGVQVHKLIGYQPKESIQKIIDDLSA